MPKLNADYPVHVNFQSSEEDKTAIRILAKMKNFANPSHLYRTIVSTYIKQAVEAMSPDQKNAFDEAVGFTKIEQTYAEAIQPEEFINTLEEAL